MRGDRYSRHYTMAPKSSLPLPAVRALQKLGRDLDKWIEGATQHPGSWWPDWLDWLRMHDKKTVKARKIGGGKSKSKYLPIEDAPGSYVKTKS